MRYLTTTDHLTGLLVDVTRDRARVRAENERLRAELRDALLDLNLAHELLAYHNIQPVEDTATSRMSGAADVAVKWAPDANKEAS